MIIPLVYPSLKYAYMVRVGSCIPFLWLKNSYLSNTHLDSRTSYSIKRDLQSRELQRIRTYPYKKLHAITSNLSMTILRVLSTSYELLKSVDLHERPLNDSVANGFALVFENTPFLLELAVFFPDVVHEHLDNQDSLIQVLHWATNLTLQSGLLSESDKTLFDNGQMELNLIPRPADYSNPHTVHQKMLKEKWAAELHKEEIRKNKRKLKKGPRLAGHQFDL